MAESPSSMLVFRQNIVFLLAYRRILHRALATHIGVTPSHLSHFLSLRKKPTSKRKANPVRVRRVKGKRPSVDNLSASSFDGIAEFLGVELWMLFRDDLAEMVHAAQGDRRRRG